MTEMTQETKDRIVYAFGHMVAEHGDGPHAADSGDEARRAILDLFDLTPETVVEDNEALLAIGCLLAVAEHVAENYEPSFDVMP